MPKIPRSEASVPYRSADMPFSTGDGYEKPGKALQQLGKGISDLGQGLGNLALGISTAQEEEDDFNARLRTLKWWNEVDKADDQHRQSYTGDGEGYEQEREGFFQGKSQELLGSLSPKAQKKAALLIEQKRAQFGNVSRTFGHQARTQYRINSTDSIITEQFNDLHGAPDDEIEDRIVGTLQGAEVIINRIPGVTENQRDALRAKARDQVFKMLETKYPGRTPEEIARRAEVLGRLNDRAKEFQAQQPPGAVDGAVKPVSEIKDFSAGRGYGSLPKEAVKHIVLHDVSGPAGTRRLPKGGSIGAYHITFDENGVYQEVPLDKRAPHATTFNDKSIAIAHIGYEGDKLSPQAIANGARAVKMVADQYGISPENILRHPELGAAGTRRGSKDPKEASWREDVLAYINSGQLQQPAAVAKQETGERPMASRALTSGMAKREKALEDGVQPVADVGSTPAIKPELTAYSPQKGGSQMQGGYAAARKGPDGKAEVRTLADLKAGTSTYITVAGDPSERGKTYIIPRIEWIDKNGERQVSENVKAVVHDTGSAFKGKGQSRFDIPVDKDMPMSALSRQPFSRQKLEFIPQGDPKQRMALGGPKEGDAPVRVADAGNRVPSAPVTDSPPRISGVTEGGRIPGPAANNNDAPVQVAQMGPRSSVWSNYMEGYNAKAPALAAARLNAIGQMVGEIEDGAAKGYAPPPDKLAKVQAAVAGTGSPELARRLEGAVAAAAQTQALQQARPEDIARYAASMRAKMIGPDGTPTGTPAQIASVEAVEKLAKSTRDALDKDPLGFGVRIGILPEVPPIDPRMEPDQMRTALQARVAAAQFMAERYGREPVYFKDGEIPTLVQTMRKGGPGLITMLGVMADQFGPEAPRAFAQIAAEGQEASVIASLGYVISKGGSPDLINDAETALRLKTEQGAKFKGVAPAGDHARSAALSVLGKSFSAMPGAEQNAIELTNLAYEARSKRLGIDPKAHPGGYDANVWKEIFREVIGESKGKDGTVYGGIDYSIRSGYVFGGNPVLLPPSIRQGHLSKVVGAIQQGDLYPVMSAPSPRVDLSRQQAPSIAGATLETTPDLAVNETGAGMPGRIKIPDSLKPEQSAATVEATQGAAQLARASGDKINKTPPVVPGAPYTADGKVLSVAQLRSAELIAVGPGRYVINTAAAGSPPEYVIGPGMPDGRYVLDINKLEPKLRQRVPNSFKPDGSMPVAEDPMDREIRSRLQMQGVRP